MSVYAVSNTPVQIVEADEPPDAAYVQEINFTPKSVHISPDIDRHMCELIAKYPGEVAELLKTIQALRVEKERVYVLGGQTCNVCTVEAAGGLFGFQVSQNGLDTYVLTQDQATYNKFIEHVRRQA